MNIRNDLGDYEELCDGCGGVRWTVITEDGFALCAWCFEDRESYRRDNQTDPDVNENEDET